MALQGRLRRRSVRRWCPLEFCTPCLVPVVTVSWRPAAAARGLVRPTSPATGCGAAAATTSTTATSSPSSSSTLASARRITRDTRDRSAACWWTFTTTRPGAGFVSTPRNTHTSLRAVHLQIQLPAVLNQQMRPPHTHCTWHAARHHRLN